MNLKLLKMARHYSGLSQEQLAEKLSIHQTVYGRYENGTRKIPIKHLKKIKEVLAENGIGMAELDFLQEVISSNK